jgi:DNA-directed RNA polymerase specialized sigma24 family protein
VSHTHDRMPAELLEQLYRHHHDPALRLLRGWLRDDKRDAAEDALADAWVILARKPASYLRADGAELTGWLVTVARRIALHHRGPELLSLDATIRGFEPPSPSVSGGHGTCASGLHPDPLADVERQALARIELAELLATLTTPEPHRPGKPGATMTPGRRRAVMSRLVGLTYRQATGATGQTWTQINRGLSEGRRVLRDRETGQ